MSDMLAHYELTSPLGAGGMGEVYRATDTRLGREVALKILPEALAKDPERIARFEREAKVLASLQHANIATVFDFTRADGKSFLVMELVEGEDLSERLERGPIPPDEARALAIQLAAGLEAAHERNIVHRDLKPANVKLTGDGQVKILDFGLARAVTGDTEDGSDPMLSPTITQAMTQAGTILGTAAYMSPEQARGKSVDKRADIWAFGVLLYEMLTGQRLFEGETTSDTLASVLKTPVDFDQLDDSIPADVRWVLQRCLDRNPTRRLRDIGEARLVLSGESTVSQMGMKAAAEPEVRRRSVFWPALSGALALALVASFVWRPDAEPESLVQAAFPLPDGVSLLLGSRQPGPPALSPDGSALVFSGQDRDGNVRLWYRRIDTAQAQALEGTESGSYPFWSPDGRSIGFFNDNNLMRLDLGSGRPLRLATGAFGKGGAWNAEGTIVYAPSYGTALARISAGGGDLPRAVTVLDSAAGENSHRHPYFLPDQDHFLFLARGARDSTTQQPSSIRVGSLSGEVGFGQAITGADGHGEYHDGLLLFAREGSLVAQAFDPASLALAGDPRVVLPGIEVMGEASRSVFSIGGAGRMVYARPRMGSTENRVTIFDRAGTVQSTVGDPAPISDIAVAPDRSRAAVVREQADLGVSSIWILDLERGTSSRFSTGGGWSVSNPVWSPDGSYLAYSEARDAVVATMVRRVDGGGAPVQIAEADLGCTPEDWSPDGRFLTYTVRFGAIHLVEMDEVGQPVGEHREVVSAPPGGAAWGSCFLGSSNWIAYHSSESGTFQIYVRHVDDASRTFQITSEGAIYPCYNAVTGELGYSELGVDMLTAVPLDFPVAGGDPVFGTPVRLFRLPTVELDNRVDFHGDTVVLSAGPENQDRVLPLFVSDWHRLLVD